MEITIKKPSQEDEQDFVDLSLEMSKFNERYFSQHYDMAIFLKKREERVRSYFRKWKEKDYRLILMAYLDGAPVGYARAYLMDSELGVGHFNELYIRDDVRNKGAGRKLLENVVGWMKEKRMSRIILSVYEWNESAIEFYKNEGFEAYSVCYEKKLTDELL